MIAVNMAYTSADDSRAGLAASKRLRQSGLAAGQTASALLKLQKTALQPG
jgi:hypothetical protein